MGRYPGTRRRFTKFASTPKGRSYPPLDRQRCEQWKDLVFHCLTEYGMPRYQRGLFLGISAVYYAARDAGCEGRFLSRDDFICAIREKLEELLDGHNLDNRTVANLALTAVLVEYSLHRRSAPLPQASLSQRLGPPPSFASANGPLETTVRN